MLVAEIPDSARVRAVGRFSGAVWMGALPLAEDVYHSLFCVLGARQPGARLPGLAPDRGVRRALGTTSMEAPFLGGDEIDHSVRGVFAAELQLPAATRAERCHRGARRVAAPLVDDVDHSRGGVAGAKLGFSCAANAVVRPCGAAWVATPFTADVGHSRMGMFRAEKR